MEIEFLSLEDSAVARGLPYLSVPGILGEALKAILEWAECLNDIFAICGFVSWIERLYLERWVMGCFLGERCRFVDGWAIHMETMGFLMQ